MEQDDTADEQYEAPMPYPEYFNEELSQKTIEWLEQNIFSPPGALFVCSLLKTMPY